MEVTEGSDGISVRTDRYRFDVHPDQPTARLWDASGGEPMLLFLLAALDTDAGLDGTVAVDAPRVTRDQGVATITLEQRSTTWASKTMTITCSEAELVLAVTVGGSGRLADVRLLGGPYTGNPRWGGGTFHSRWAARTLFNPNPDDPKRTAQPASEPTTIGVTGGALPGRGHWFFTPAPFVIAGSAAETTSADDPAAAPWTAFELRTDVDGATFTEWRYAPFLGGFSFELAYDGQTSVDGSFTTPPLAIRPAVEDPYRAVAHHAEGLRRAGAAPTVDRVARPEWWSRPIFCGWGEQCRHKKLHGGHATQYSRRDLYDRWLGVLASHDIVPGTVVIDDRWQTTYGRNEPDLERWPDLRGWIADRHADGQRVLLWFKAWDPEGLPLDACVTDPLDQPVAADPTSPAYESILREALEQMLGGGGLDADGLKIDFTAQTPAGPGLRRQGHQWGVALLHRLLRLIHGIAKEVKPESLIVTHAASPLFADVADMLRLNDLLRLDDPDPFAAAVPQMRHRARIAAAVDPGLLIDTDDWCMPSKAEWRSYLAVKPELGVPALYYATGIDHSGEAFGDDDYAAIRAAWAAWEARRVQHG